MIGKETPPGIKSHLLVLCAIEDLVLDMVKIFAKAEFKRKMSKILKKFLKKHGTISIIMRNRNRMCYNACLITVRYLVQYFKRGNDDRSI